MCRRGRAKMTEISKGKARDDWDAVFAGSDVCYAPVLSMSEVRHHPHHQARGTFIDDGDVWQPAPAPRFSRTNGELRCAAATIGEHTKDVLREFGFSDEDIKKRLESGAIHSHSA